VISALDAQFAAHTAKLAESLKTANEQLRNIALYDSLTGLPNRFLLDDRLGQTLAHAERAKTTFALMFVDLDKFKPVNDSFGHSVGDELLKAVAGRLTNCLRKGDTVARVGGDEFVVVLSEIKQAQDAAVVGSKILRELSKPFSIAQHELDISCSIGISVYPNDGNDVKTLKANADLAMYHVKKTGRNNYQLFMPEMGVASLGAQ